MIEKNYWDIKWKEQKKCIPDSFNEYISEMGDLVKLNLITLKNIIDNYNFRNRLILDIGGGKGFNLKFLFDESNKKELFDLSKEAVEFSRNIGIDSKCLDIINADLSEYKNKYDVICLFEVIEHIHPLNNDTLVDKLHFLLKGNGILFVTTPNLVSITSRLKMLFGLKPNIFTVDPTHINPFRIKDIEKLFSRKFSKIYLNTTNIQLPIKKSKYITFPYKCNLGESIISVWAKNEI